MFRIIIADDHAVMRAGLKALLTGEDCRIVAEASDGFEVLPLVDSHQPDLLIIDLNMPNLGGVEAIARLSKIDSKPLILVLTAREDEAAVKDAFAAGANGYVPKSSGAEELLQAIAVLKKGQRYISPVIAGSFLAAKHQSSHPLDPLSSREREVMKLLAEGHPNRQVAKLLHISVRTIDSHRANILKKLGISSNAEMTQFAIKSGLIEHE